jgi:predicted nuclease of predicted toxin-antitoxin system
MKLLSDEDFNGRIVRGLLRRFPTLDLVRVQDVGLTESHDTQVLAWAAQENRLVLTHDFATMVDFAYGRVADGLEMPALSPSRKIWGLAKP